MASQRRHRLAHRRARGVHPGTGAAVARENAAALTPETGRLRDNGLERRLLPGNIGWRKNNFRRVGGVPRHIDRIIRVAAVGVQITGRVEKQFSSSFQAAASYTRSSVRDVQSITTISPALTYAFWSGGRTVAGRHDDLSTGVSSYEIPHRVVVAGTWTAPWTRWATGISLYYVGESGLPFTFTDSTAGDPTRQATGDLNADGSNANDPIYVPRNAADTAEIVFTATDVARQQAALESIIAKTPCLRR